MIPFDTDPEIVMCNMVADKINLAQAKATAFGNDGRRETLGRDPDTIWFSEIELASAALEEGDWSRALLLLDLHAVHSARRAGAARTRTEAKRKHADIRAAANKVEYLSSRKNELYRLATEFKCSTRTVENALRE